MAPNEKVINWDLVELYLKAGCSQTKIAQSLFIDEDTLRRRVKSKYGIEYGVLAANLRSEGDMLIEAKQFEKAAKGYWPALLWLGKVRLSQKEPETNEFKATNQPQIDYEHVIMAKDHEIDVLKDKLLELQKNGNEPKTE